MKYCGNCGRKLESNEICDCANKMECPVCHYLNKKDAISCPRCGNDFNKPEAKKEEIKKVLFLILGAIIVFLGVALIFSQIEFNIKDIFNFEGSNIELPITNNDEEDNKKETTIPIENSTIQELYKLYQDGENELSQIILFSANKTKETLTDQEKLNFVLRSLIKEQMIIETIHGLDLTSLEQVSWTNVKIEKNTLIEKLKELFGPSATFNDLDNFKEYIYIEQGENEVVNKLFLFESNNDILEGNEVTDSLEIEKQRLKDVKTYSAIKEAYKIDNKIYITVNYVYYKETITDITFDGTNLKILSLYFDSKKEKLLTKFSTQEDTKSMIDSHVNSGNEVTIVFEQVNDKYYFVKTVN